MQADKRKQNKGFTLVELMVVLAIMAIIATLAGIGIVSYMKLARFNQNEANARTVYQAAQTAMTRLDAGGALEECISNVKSEGVGIRDTYYTKTGDEPADATVEDIHNYVYALFYNKNDTESAAAKAVTELIGDYIYDASLLDASICIEIDTRSGEIFAVFYDSHSDAMTFGESAGATNITDRSYSHRRNDSLVGYYSVDDLVNVVPLEQRKLKIRSLSIKNEEALKVYWSGSAADDTDVVYTLAVYDETSSAADEAQKKLFDIQISLYELQDINGQQYDKNSAMAKLKVRQYTDGVPGDEKEYVFPLTCQNGNFCLTLDAMVSAEILQQVKANPALAASSSFSITRLLGNEMPNNIYVTMQAAPREDSDAESRYTASDEYNLGNPRGIDANPLFADDTVLSTGSGSGKITYYRHLYNLRWLNSDQTATFTIELGASQNRTLNWTGGEVVVYQPPKNPGQTEPEKWPVAATPSPANVVAFPTVESLPANVTLDGGSNTLRNLQLRTESVASDESGYYAKYAGIFGHNYGIVQNLTIRDLDAVVNVAPANAAADEITSAIEAVEAGTLASTDIPLKDLRAVGALCGLNTGILRGITLAQSTGSTSRVIAAVQFNNTLQGGSESTDSAAISANLTTTAASLRGIGGIAGISRPVLDGGDTANLSGTAENLTANGTVSGILIDCNTSATGAQTTDEGYYTAASATNASYRPVGIGGVIGMMVAPRAATLNLTNAATVSGNAYTGGVLGCVIGRPAYSAASPTTLNGLANTGLVQATVSSAYKNATSAKPESNVYGRFFGGVAGYSAFIGLDNATSAAPTAGTADNLTLTAVQANLAADGQTLLMGDFVGGLIGFADSTTITNCTSGSSAGLTTDAAAATNYFVLGNRFVGGLVGGGSAVTIGSSEAAAHNYAITLGHKYVGGAAGANAVNTAGTAGSTITNVVNHAPIAAVSLAYDETENADNAAFAGGIVGYNGFGTASGNAKATITNCSSAVNDSGGTFYDFLAGCGAENADFVGGIAGCNNAEIETGEATVAVVLSGHDYIGGVAGANTENGEITAAAGIALSVSGRIGGRYAVGGVIGLNRASVLLGQMNITPELITGYRCVGGVIGANLPDGSFELTDEGAVTVESVDYISGDAAVGGIIGYNCLLAEGSAPQPGDTSTLAAHYADLLPTFDDDNNVIADGEVQPGDTAITLKNLSSSIALRANAYAGGIIGYNSESTALTLEGCTNSGTLTCTTDAYTGKEATIQDGVSVNAFLGSHGYGETYRLTPDDTQAHFIGGIISINTQNAKLEGCTNSGNISGAANVLGGIAGLNEGVIEACANEVNLGSNQQSYVGGIAGINASNDNTNDNRGKITGCTVNSATGYNNVGGTVGANLWGAVIEVPDGYSITVTGSGNGNSNIGGIAGLNYSTVSGTVASGSISGGTNIGGAVGLNYGTVQALTIGEGVTVSGTENVGGVVGYNNEKSSIGGDNNKVVSKAALVSSNINYAGGTTGYNAGGVAGRNEGAVTNAEYNNANGKIIANNQYAGGIAGANTGTGSLLSGCTLANAAEISSGRGIAGGITALNEGAVSGCKFSGGKVTSSGADSVNGTSVMAVGGIAAVSTGSVSGCSVSGGALAGRAVYVGGLVGYNLGALTGSEVEAMPAPDGLTGSGISLGGAVGYNAAGAVTGAADGSAAGDAVTVAADITASDKYVNLGGVAGENYGTLGNCTYSGTINETDTGALLAGSTVGGIVGSNSGTAIGCHVTAINLQVTGRTDANSAQSAAEKLTRASHVGGIAGRNSANALVSGCTVGGASTSTSIIAAKYGFVGGVAGSNAGTITASGGASTADDSVTPTTQDMLTQVSLWLRTTTTDAETGQERPKTTQEINADRNTMIRVLTNAGSSAEETALAEAYAKITGIDTVSRDGNADKVYSAAANGNDVLVALHGGSSANDMANGCLGGITGFNSVEGSITSSATGKWFVYCDNATMDSPAGGMIGQNESNAANSGLLNCAAVRRYSYGAYSVTVNKSTNIRTVSTPKDPDKDDDANANNRLHSDANDGEKSAAEENVAHIGGVIGYQQNRTSGDWELSNLVNCGSVFNSRSNNVGGVIAYWQSNGGTVSGCFNFGLLTTNMNDGNSSGGAGGVIGYYDKPTNGISSTIRSCQNYGSIYYDKQGANDVAGIIGRVSRADADDTLTINIIDCVNGRVSLKAHSLASGIFGYLGPYQADINNITINIDRCRNFCYGGNITGTYKAGISGNRSDGRASAAGIVVTNCFSLWDSCTTQSEPILYSPNELTENNEGSGNNYYMDNYSFNATYNKGLKQLTRTEQSGTKTDLVKNLTVTSTDGSTVSQSFIAGLFDAKKNGTDVVYKNSNGIDLTISFDLVTPRSLYGIKLNVDDNDSPDSNYTYTVTATLSNGTTVIFGNGNSKYYVGGQYAFENNSTITSLSINIQSSKKTLLLKEVELIGSRSGIWPWYSYDWLNYADKYGDSAPQADDATFTSGSLRLYAGIDTTVTGTANDYTYFGARLSPSTRPSILTGSNSWVAVAASSDIADPAQPRTIASKTNDGTATSGELYLLFNDNNGNGSLDINDVTDEAIQNYYINILDAAALQKPVIDSIEMSGAGEENYVYGRYEIKWHMPESGGNPERYEVNITLNSPDDTPVEGNSITQTVYATAYTFEVPQEWEQYVTGDGQYTFTTTVTAINSKSSAVSEPVQTNLARPLPTPQMHVQLVKNSGGTYSRMLVLDNADEYNALPLKTADGTEANMKDQWTVTANFVGGAAGDSYTFDGSTTSIAISGYSGSLTLRAVATVNKPTDSTETPTAQNTAAQSTYFRSAQLSEPIYLPANSYTSGNLTATAVVDAASTNISNLKITATLKFENAADAPLYHIALLGQAKESSEEGSGAADTENNINLQNQYITLASADRTLTNTATTVTFSGLAADTLDKYTNFTVVAVPYTSGTGPYYTYRQLSADEISSTGLGADAKDAVWTSGYEIIANSDGSYTYREVTPFKDLSNGTAACGMAALNIRVLSAPQLNELGAPAAADELTYTFSWVPVADTDGGSVEGQRFAPTLTGLMLDSDGKVISETPIDLSGTYTDNTKTEFTINADDWGYSRVRLTVARVGDAAKTPAEIGSAAAKDYAVKQRLEQISAPTAALAGTDHRDLMYTVSWAAPTDATLVKNYTVYVTDNAADNPLVQSFSTADATPASEENPQATPAPTTLNIDLEAFGGKDVSIYVVSKPFDDDAEYVLSPNGIAAPLSVPSRYATPVIKEDGVKLLDAGAEITPDEQGNTVVSLSDFRSKLQVSITLEGDAAALSGNYMFSAYFFDTEDAAKAAATAINESYTMPDKYSEDKPGGYQDAFGVSDNSLLGGYPMAASGSTLTATMPILADNAGRYMVIRLCAVPNAGIASKWVAYATALRLPQIKLDTPVGTDATTPASGTAALYSGAPSAETLLDITADISYTRRTAEWQPIELAGSYEVELVPLTGDAEAPLYPAATAKITVAQADTPNEDGTVTAKNSITKVEKTVNIAGKDITFEIPATVTAAADGSETAASYDLSMTIAVDADGTPLQPTGAEGEITFTVTGEDGSSSTYLLVSQPVYLDGRINVENVLLYYRLDTVPTLTYTLNSSGEAVYSIVLPDTNDAICADTLRHNLTAAVNVTAIGSKDSLRPSDMTEIAINGSNGISLASEEGGTEEPVGDGYNARVAALAAQLMQVQPTPTLTPAPTQAPATPETAAEAPAVPTAVPQPEQQPAAEAAPEQPAAQVAAPVQGEVAAAPAADAAQEGEVTASPATDAVQESDVAAAPATDAAQEGEATASPATDTAEESTETVQQGEAAAETAEPALPEDAPDAGATAEVAISEAAALTESDSAA